MDYRLVNPDEKYDRAANFDDDDFRVHEKAVEIEGFSTFAGRARTGRGGHTFSYSSGE
jgi:hypothetical protein